MLDTSYIGTISYGTLKPENLARTFVDFLLEVGEADESLDDELRWLLDRLEATEAACDLLWDTPACRKGYQEELSRLQEYLEWFLSDVYDVMDRIAPPGTYFGAHPGDGADFGFWYYEDEA